MNESQHSANDPAKIALAKIEKIKATPKTPAAQCENLESEAFKLIHNEKNYALALLFYNAALSLKLTDKDTIATVYEERGAAFLNLGNFANAIQDYTKALELRPNYREAKKGLAEAQAKMAATGNVKSPAPSTPLSTSPTSSGSPNSSADLSRSSSEERSPDRTRVQSGISGSNHPAADEEILKMQAELAELKLKRNKITVKHLIAALSDIQSKLLGEAACKLLSQRDKTQAELEEMEAILLNAPTVEPQKRGVFKKKSPSVMVMYKGKQITVDELKKEKDKTSATLEACKEKLWEAFTVQPQDVKTAIKSVQQQLAFVSALSDDKIANLTQEQWQQLDALNRSILGNTSTNSNANDEIIVPQRTAAAVQQPQAPALPPKKPTVPVAAGVDYSWMHQQAAAPRPAQAQQPQSVSQLLNNAYGRK